MRSDKYFAICLLLAPALCSAKMDAAAVSTCELIDSGSTFDGQLVAVKAHINTDVMHFTHLESAGCSQKQISMYFAEDSNFKPCRDAECPLNGEDYLIEATFVGVYHATKLSLQAKLPTLEVKEVQDMTRTPRRVLFERRVQAAKDLEATSSGKAYQDAMWPVVEPFLRALIKQCLAKDEKPDWTSFVWVATLTSDGQPADMQVQPWTAVADCFADGMEQAPFPSPPKEFADGLPVTFNMRLHPMN